MKPGYQTTEFWVTLTTNLVGLLILFGLLSPEDSDAIVQAVEQIAGGLISGLSSMGYALSRGSAKQG